MKLVICLMGYQFSGANIIENYLIETYGIKKYKGYTSRLKRSKKEKGRYHFVDLATMIELDNQLIGVREYNGNFYGRKLADIPDGISVGVTDYFGYLALKEKVATLPIFVERGLRNRFEHGEANNKKNHDNFIHRDAEDKIQFDILIKDKDVVKINYTGLNNTFIEIDNIIFPLLGDIKKFNLQEDKE